MDKIVGLRTSTPVKDSDGDPNLKSDSEQDATINMDSQSIYLPDNTQPLEETGTANDDQEAKQNAVNELKAFLVTLESTIN